MKRKASAEWNGSLKEGKGSISTESGVLSKTQYSFDTRFESGVGTNPEELVAAAHAACFSMQLSALIGKAGLVPDHVSTTASITFDNLDQATAQYRGTVLSALQDVADSLRALQDDLVQLHGLRDVVVHSRIQADLAVALHGVGRERDDLRLAVRR